MILRHLALKDFGIYGGEFLFDLAPRQDKQARPIVIFRGKNGVGKSTILEAIRLCLHGSLALGPRISRVEYSDYLEKKIHRPGNLDDQRMDASVEVAFEFTRIGQKATYVVTRSWRRSGNRVVETLNIVEDNKPLSDFGTDQKEIFLRELISPNATDIFFFDAERLHALAEGDKSNGLLVETTKTLFGLTLVESLQRDIDVYINRQDKDRANLQLQVERDELSLQLSDLEMERAKIEAEQHANEEEAVRLHIAIVAQEQKIAGEGTVFASRRERLKTSDQHLLAEINRKRINVQELSSGLLPFAIAPQMCRAVHERLKKEQEYNQIVIAQELLQRQIERLNIDLASPDFWGDTGVNIDSEMQARVAEKIQSTLATAIPNTDITFDEVILRVSNQDHDIMLGWIDQSLTSIPARFCSAVKELETLEYQLAETRQELSRVPEDDVLKPLMESLNDLHRDLGGVERQSVSYTERISRIDYEIQQVQWKINAIEQQTMDLVHNRDRVQMALRTQAMLKEYASELMREKMQTLARVLIERFNALCRKDRFFEAAKIDPTNLKTTLYRNGLPFDRSQLSAGEKQLLATAMMWALRDVSGLPMPVIIDTPVGRLDTDHRRSMMRNYFPRASHQVILLITDAELDEGAVKELALITSHRYDLTFDAGTNSTSIGQHNLLLDLEVANA